jgi:sporulation protein YlmC with PRC-barrel domain
MLLVQSAVKGYAIEASDGGIGTVSDFLFDDTTWMVRWLAIDTGIWLPGRKVLVHPSAIEALDGARKQLSVALTRGQVEASPDIRRDLPVSRQMEASLYDYYSWDPLWTKDLPVAEAAALRLPPGVPFGSIDPAGDGANSPAGAQGDARGQDPHLRSSAAVTGSRILASDGEIGHVEDLLIDDSVWSVRSLIVDTRNWWPGKHVLLSTHAVSRIDWVRRQVEVDISREQIKANPAWDPAEAAG